MSRAELEDALAGVLKGKEIRPKNNRLPLQPRCIEQFKIPRVQTHWPIIFAVALIYRQSKLFSFGALVLSPVNVEKHLAEEVLSALWMLSWRGFFCAEVSTKMVADQDRSS